MVAALLKVFCAAFTHLYSPTERKTKLDHRVYIEEATRFYAETARVLRSASLLSGTDTKKEGGGGGGLF